MRANTKKKHKMGKRFAIVIGVAAVGVMALGAQTVMADHPIPTHGPPGHHDPIVPWHGGLGSEVRKCVEGRRVILFQQLPGPDRKLGSDRIKNKNLGEAADPADPGWFRWYIWASMDGRVYAKVMPKVRDGFVCRADRSRTVVNGRAWIPKNPGPPPSATGEPPAVVKYDSKLTITRN
jgi:hypothetical protein